MQLIPLWGGEECLFRVSCAEYKDKGKILNALERIREKMEEEDLHCPTIIDIQTKIHSLKVYYCATRNKHDSSKKSGSGTDDIVHIKWPYYHLLSFLSDSITSRKTVSNLNYSGLGSSLYEDETPPSKKSKRKIQNRMEIETPLEERELLNTACDLMKSSEKAQIEGPK